MNEIQEDYLGDGVYASSDGFGITLDLRGQDDTTRIVLEPNVLLSLINFAVKVGMLKPTPA